MGRIRTQKMRWAALCALGGMAAFAAASAALAAKPTVVRHGNLILTFNGGVTPTRLSKTTPTPVALHLASGFAAADGTHPPALTEFIIETDRNGVIDARGIPVCKQSKLKARDSNDAEKACPKAIVGTGTAEVEVEFPEQKPIPVKSKLLVFNGGVKGATTTIFIHAYLRDPVSATVVTRVKVSRVRNGSYGLRSVGLVPRIAGGSGSITRFDLTIGKKFDYRGRTRSYLAATCPDGKIAARAEPVFANGERARASVTRPCTPTE